MGKSKNKNAGSSFEYRIANWFADRPGWNGLRNPLSGASEQIKESVSLHDVRAWHNSLPIFLQIEAKKRTRVKDPKRRDQIEIKSEWTDKIDFSKDELLVFATDRSDLYAFIPTQRYFQILGRAYPINYTKENIFGGDKQFLMKREYIDQTEDKIYHLFWMDLEWTVLRLEDFVTLRETANLDDQLSQEDKIKRLVSLDKAEQFEDLYLSELNYKQKRLLYTKLEELESGSLINPIAHSNDQFWLGDDAFILVCPFCEQKIYKKDLKKESTNE